MQPAPQQSALEDTPQASELQTARGTLRLGPFVTQQRELKHVQILAEQLCWAPRVVSAHFLGDSDSH